MGRTDGSRAVPDYGGVGVKVKEAVETLKKKQFVFKHDILNLYTDELLYRAELRSQGSPCMSISVFKGVQKEMLPWIRKVADGIGHDGAKIEKLCLKMDESVLQKISKEGKLHDD